MAGGNEFWDKLGEAAAIFDEGKRRINRRFAAAYATQTQKFKGPDSIETHLKTIEKELRGGKIDKEATRAILKEKIAYNYETFEQAWKQTPDDLKHMGRPKKPLQKPL